MDQPSLPPSNYPIARPTDGTDARFTIGMVLDVGSILTARGYPPLSPRDLVRLQQAIFDFIYSPPEGGS